MKNNYINYFFRGYSHVWEIPNICIESEYKGILSPVNFPFLLKFIGKDSKKIGKILLINKTVGFLATYSHTLRARTVKPSFISSQVKDSIGDEDFHRIVYENPQKLTEDKDIARVEYDLYTKRRSLSFGKNN